MPRWAGRAASSFTAAIRSSESKGTMPPESAFPTTDANPLGGDPATAALPSGSNQTALSLLDQRYTRSPGLYCCPSAPDSGADPVNGFDPPSRTSPTRRITAWRAANAFTPTSRSQTPGL